MAEGKRGGRRPEATARLAGEASGLGGLLMMGGALLAAAVAARALRRWRVGSAGGGIEGGTADGRAEVKDRGLIALERSLPVAGAPPAPALADALPSPPPASCCVRRPLEREASVHVGALQRSPHREEDHEHINSVPSEELGESFDQVEDHTNTNGPLPDDDPSQVQESGERVGGGEEDQRQLDLEEEGVHLDRGSENGEKYHDEESKGVGEEGEEDQGQLEEEEEGGHLDRGSESGLEYHGEESEGDRLSHGGEREDEKEEESDDQSAKISSSSNESTTESRWLAEESESSTTTLEEYGMKRNRDKAFGDRAAFKAAAAEGEVLGMGVEGASRRADQMAKKPEGVFGFLSALMLVAMLMLMVHSQRERIANALMRSYHLFFPSG